MGAIHIFANHFVVTGTTYDTYAVHFKNSMLRLWMFSNIMENMKGIYISGSGDKKKLFVWDNEVYAQHSSADRPVVLLDAFTSSSQIHDNIINHSYPIKLSYNYAPNANRVYNNRFDSGATIDVTASTEIWGNKNYVTENTVYSDAFAIDAVALKTVTIPHGCHYSPRKSHVRLTVVEDTDVDDWGYDLLKVDTVDATNVTVKINVSSASATGGATAKIAMRVERVPM